ncbi:MAG: hypothetical protein JSS09_01885 [Verrucomicrobia bacterium]|nr:hypothetical protein [Verrucomicrobiota bacterium]
MEINHKILSIPPYISTSWKNIISLKTEAKENLFNLSIQLQDGSSICIPNMEYHFIETLFFFHAKHLESETVTTQTPSSFIFRQSLDGSLLPPLLENTFAPLVNIKFLSKLSTLCQHDPQNSNAPKLPEEVLEQFSQISKSIPIENPENLPQPEPHCNCPYCQITQAIRSGLETKASFSPPEREEEVSDEDLSFRSWIIEPLENNTYKVSHPDLKQEHHLVSLESPIHCTCGSDQCEHILAVLRS